MIMRPFSDLVKFLLWMFENSKIKRLINFRHWVHIKVLIMADADVSEADLFVKPPEYNGLWGGKDDGDQPGSHHH